MEVLIFDDFERGLAVFLKRFKSSGLLAELRRREAYESPSSKRKRKRLVVMRRLKRLEAKRQRNEETWRGRRPITSTASLEVKEVRQENGE